MAFTAKDVQALREKTNVGMMDCKKALVEADGDMDKAIDILREKGLATAARSQAGSLQKALSACIRTAALPHLLSSTVRPTLSATALSSRLLQIR